MKGTTITITCGQCGKKLELEARRVKFDTFALTVEVAAELRWGIWGWRDDEWLCSGPCKRSKRQAEIEKELAGLQKELAALEAE